jgi:hypothetical protein
MASTIYVDKVDPASGTALEIGSSGDTITIPSGATITNSGTATGFGGGLVLQVVKSTVTTAQEETTSTTAVEIDTDLRCTLTPASASSKFMVQFFTTVRCAAGENMAFALYRKIGSGSFAKVSDGACTEAFRQRNSDHLQLSTTLMVYDHPNTTDAVIYTPYWWCPSTGTVRINDNGMGSFTLATEVSS